MVTAINKLGEQVLRIETFFPDKEEYQQMQQLVHCETHGIQMGFWNDYPDVSDYLDEQCIKLMCQPTDHLKYFLAQMSGGNKDVALLLMSAVKVLAEQNRIYYVGISHFTAHFQYNLLDQKALAEMAAKEKVKAILQSPTSWSV